VLDDRVSPIYTVIRSIGRGRYGKIAEVVVTGGVNFLKVGRGLGV